MLDPILLRNHPEKVAKKLARRGFKLDVNKLRILEKHRKILQVKTENLRAERNARSKSIGQTKELGGEIESLYSEANKLGKELHRIEEKLNSLQEEIRNILLTIPNIPDDSVPVGKEENSKIEVKCWGTPPEFFFKVRDHVTLGEMHLGLDFSAATKLTGSRFVVMKGQIAQLHRALMHFMLDLHTKEHGYSEIYVPYLVNRDSLYGTGQLPKFYDDLFHIHPLYGEDKSKNYSLIPTAEVPLINLVRDKVFNEEDLPIKLTAHSPCFRAEAGSYGRDTRGLIRMHQFDKIEMVHIVCPEKSMDALEEITCHAEKVLELLDLPYRRMLLYTSDMAFSACKTYDLEVWVPAQKNYCEISSCSNTGDFQARRIGARFRKKWGKNTQFVHTLNGSGLAVGRTLLAVMENFQQADGRIKIPKLLRPYMEGRKYIGE